MVAGPEKRPILSDWRQGDFTLDAELEIPVLIADEEGPLFGAVTGAGIVLISQSCDIVRNEDERPHVQVAPLVNLTPEELRQIARRRKPQFATFAALEKRGLAIDLDVAATVDKRVVAEWPREPGCANDREREELAAALARHKRRFAFSDDFNRSLKDFRAWIDRRTEQKNANGEMIRAVEQIRVRCDDWEAEVLELEFICILNREATPAERLAWRAPVAELQRRLTSIYPTAFVRLVSPDEYSLAEYRASVRIDLDGLSEA